MKAFQSVSEFRAYRTAIMAGRNSEKPCIVICGGTGGQASGSNDLIRILKRQILEENLHDKLSLRITGCLGFCEMDPFIIVEPGYNLYPKLTMEDVPRIVDAAVKGEVVEELLYREPGSTIKRFSEKEIPFFQGQTRLILGQNQNLDPIRIHDYLKMGGYAALEKVLGNPDTEWIVDEILKSGLRGRGGAGFLTGRKWELARNVNFGRGPKYIICNADEGDPGAYMDRSMLEGNPHAIIEGITIAALAIGAGEGIIYVRTEYPLAIKHAAIALRDARRLGLLGENILGRGIDFDIRIFHGAGAFVCGEETALIKSVEGQMGEPRQRPPYPILKGLFGHPTCINNVETLANIPYIINNGAEEYAKIGTRNNTGTKIFSLVGKIKNTGLVEVPLGTPISKVVYAIGGGSASSAKIKAIQTGGPSGGCIPASMFDLPIDYDSLTGAGSIMGSGGMIVMDQDSCMVDVAKYFMSFLKNESCGKCFTCRKGTQRMYEILEDITLGKGIPEHLGLLEELALTVKDTSMCGLGQSAPNPVLSTLRYFRKEYERHIIDKRCDAYVCKELTGAPCQAACPVDTEPWRYVALVEKGDYEEAYRVIRSANPFSAVSARVCNRECENRCSLGKSGSDAVAIRDIKRFVTDRVEPSVFKLKMAKKNGKKVAVIGAGPAGLTAAHELSLLGYSVTVFEAQNMPGGMLTCSLPAYRLPRSIVDNEIKTLLNRNISIEYGCALGKDMTIEDLIPGRFNALFLSIGAHGSRRLDLENEDIDGVFPSIEFLKAFNVRGEEHARGHVGILGGGNSAVDAARVALRQKAVTAVSLYYRRTREEMPAYKEEVAEALEEGIELETLVTPVRIVSKEGRFTGIEYIKNRLGDMDATGRRKPVPMPGTEFKVELDTLIVAIGEKPESEFLSSMGVAIDKSGRALVNNKTLETNLKGVFAGGDLVTGPNTVIDAVAAGKKAARSIDLFLSGRQLVTSAIPKIPNVYIEPPVISELDEQTNTRVEPETLKPSERIKNFKEVTMTLPENPARAECRRCLRCDLEFTRRISTDQPDITATRGAHYG
ncbi:MAG: FAD-dependent oxidoreductase [Syntrophales bacterium]|nr:FAD-dependent oxidoreductase [Syntrophales bacterium]MCK9528508.1 FAD-dependent oxidoreductase [Syntrophales bacterium]MDX9922866.1 NADH-ubiquinone oxidoreductase-F iron-sulfur binding region domain-containing protein [Syntrophales bacterium]